MIAPSLAVQYAIDSASQVSVMKLLMRVSCNAGEAACQKERMSHSAASGCSEGSQSMSSDAVSVETICVFHANRLNTARMCQLPVVTAKWQI